MLTNLADVIMFASLYHEGQIIYDELYLNNEYLANKLKERIEKYSSSKR